MHVFKHPKYYEEMRQRAKKFQREEKLKQQASSTKHQAPRNWGLRLWQEIQIFKNYLKTVNKPIRN